MGADFANTAPCATLLGTLLMESPKGDTTSKIVRGLCEMDLVNEWPYGTAEEKKDAALLLKEARGLSLETLDREFTICSSGRTTSKRRLGDRFTSIPRLSSSAIPACPSFDG